MGEQVFKTQMSKFKRRSGSWESNVRYVLQMALFSEETTWKPSEGHMAVKKYHVLLAVLEVFSLGSIISN